MCTGDSCIVIHSGLRAFLPRLSLPRPLLRASPAMVAAFLKMMQERRGQGCHQYKLLNVDSGTLKQKSVIAAAGRRSVN